MNQTNQQPPKLYSLNEVAERLGVSERTIRNYINAGRITAIPWVHRGKRVPEAELSRIEREGINTRGIVTPTKKNAQPTTPAGSVRKSAKMGER